MRLNVKQNTAYFEWCGSHLFKLKRNFIARITIEMLFSVLFLILKKNLITLSFFISLLSFFSETEASKCHCSVGQLFKSLCILACILFSNESVSMQRVPFVFMDPKYLNYFLQWQREEVLATRVTISVMNSLISVKCFFRQTEDCT